MTVTVDLLRLRYCVKFSLFTDDTPFAAIDRRFFFFFKPGDPSPQDECAVWETRFVPFSEINVAARNILKFFKIESQVERSAFRCGRFFRENECCLCTNAHLYTNVVNYDIHTYTHTWEYTIIYYLLETLIHTRAYNYKYYESRYTILYLHIIEFWWVKFDSQRRRRKKKAHKD